MVRPALFGTLALTIAFCSSFFERFWFCYILELSLFLLEVCALAWLLITRLGFEPDSIMVLSR